VPRPTHEKQMGNMLRVSRESKGISQVRLAQKLKMSSQVISGIERGLIRIPKHLIKSYTRNIGVDAKVVIEDYAMRYRRDLYKRNNMRAPKA